MIDLTEHKNRMIDVAKRLVVERWSGLDNLSEHDDITAENWINGTHFFDTWKLNDYKALTNYRIFSSTQGKDFIVKKAEHGEWDHWDLIDNEQVVGCFERQDEAIWASKNPYTTLRNNFYSMAMNQYSQARFSVYRTFNFYPEDDRRKIFDNKEIHLDGNFYAVSCFNQAYWHAVEDFYWFLPFKKFMPDGKLIIFTFSSLEESRFGKRNSYLQGLIDLYKKQFGDDVIIIDEMDYTTVYCENFYSYTYKLYEKLYGTEYDPVSLYRDLIDSYMPDVPMQNKKVMLYSESKYQNQDKIYEGHQDLIKNYIEKGIVSESGLVLQMPENVSQKDKLAINQIADILARRLEDKDKNKIFSFFESKGYEAVDPGKLNYDEQIRLYKSCSHIAIPTGAMALASLMCNKNTQIIMFTNNTNYDFPHNKMVDEAIKNAIHVFDPRDSIKKQYTVEQMLTVLEKEYGDRI